MVIVKAGDIDFYRSLLTLRRPPLVREHRTQTILQDVVSSWQWKHRHLGYPTVGFHHLSCVKVSCACNNLCVRH